MNVAAFQQRQPLPLARTNGDEKRYANFIGNFSKTPPHDAFGIVDPAAYKALRHAMNTGDADDFAAIVHGGIGKLANPQQSAFAFQLDGADSHHPDVRAPAAFGSAEEAGEPWAGSPPYWPFDSRVTSKANKGSAIATLENSPTSLP